MKEIKKLNVEDHIMVGNSLQMSSMGFFENQGIKRQFSEAKTPQQNGVAKRKNRTVQEVARTMLNEEKLLDGYWREAIYTTVYVLNRGQLRVNSDKTPYE